MLEHAEFDENISLTDDRRDSFRCSVQQAEEAAILRTRKTDLIVRLIEKSAGGFGLLAQSEPPIQPGDVLSLATANGCFEVRVAHITELDGQSRVGVSHVRELSFMPAAGGLAGWGRQGLFSLTRVGLQLTLICTLCVAFFTFGLTLPANWWRELLDMSKSRDAASASPFSSWSADQEEKRLAQGFVNLDGIKARKFIETLKLSTAQQIKVQSIIEDTSLALANLYQHKDAGPADIWSDLGLQLIHRSYEKIQRELTPEQRARWAELSS